MGRQTKDYPPVLVPTEAEIRIAAVLFDYAGKDGLIGGTPQVMIHFKDGELASWLAERFGGTIYGVGMNCRWQVNRQRMLDFLAVITPFVLTGAGRGKIEAVLFKYNALTQAAAIREAATAKPTRKTQDVVTAGLLKIDAVNVTDDFHSDFFEGELMILASVPDDGEEQAFRTSSTEKRDLLQKMAEESGYLTRIDERGPQLLFIRKDVVLPDLTEEEIAAAMPDLEELIADDLDPDDPDER